MKVAQVLHVPETDSTGHDGAKGHVSGGEWQAIGDLTTLTSPALPRTLNQSPSDCGLC